MASPADTSADPYHHRLLVGAFLVQSLLSAVLWFTFDDRPDVRAYANSDFGQWLTANVVSAVLLAALGSVVLRRRSASLVVAGGCLVAVAAACVLYVGYVVLAST